MIHSFTSRPSSFSFSFFSIPAFRAETGSPKSLKLPPASAGWPCLRPSSKSHEVGSQDGRKFHAQTLFRHGDLQTCQPILSAFWGVDRSNDGARAGKDRRGPAQAL